MNFKDQMQEKAELNLHIIEWGNLAEGNDMRRVYADATKAALSSDLVKGLVEALEFADDHIYLLDGSEESHAVVDKIQTALTNYKQEVK